MRKAIVTVKNKRVGILTEDENGFEFRYDKAYLTPDDAEPISLTMPLREEPYRDHVLFPFISDKRTSTTSLHKEKS